MTRQKFRDAMQLWFWFCYSYAQKRNALRRADMPSEKRCCELLDVETLITKLYLCGRLTDNELSVMGKWGNKRREPNPNVFAESHDAKSWESAMKTLQAAFKKVDWID